jgi:uroporphyrinogen-III decarboxylase
LAFGTPAQIEEHVKEMLGKLGHGGGYIPGPAHDYLNIPLENALALRDAIHKHGKYPLQV